MTDPVEVTVTSPVPQVKRDDAVEPVYRNIRVAGDRDVAGDIGRDAVRAGIIGRNEYPRQPALMVPLAVTLTLLPAAIVVAELTALMPIFPAVMTSFADVVTVKVSGPLLRARMPSSEVPVMVALASTLTVTLPVPPLRP